MSGDGLKTAPSRESKGSKKPRRTMAMRLKQWVKDSPAWAISIGLHLAIVLGATLVYLEQFLTSDEGEVVINMRKSEAPKLTEIDRAPEKKQENPEESTEDADASAQTDDAQPEETSGPETTETFASGLEGPGSGADRSLGVVDASETGRRVGIPGMRGRGRRRETKKAEVEKPSTEEGVLAALRWLARHQNADGSWSVAAHEKNCGRYGYRDDCSGGPFNGNDQYQVGVTALSLLAFLGAGHLPSDREPVFAEGAAPAGTAAAALAASAAASGAEDDKGGRPLSYGEVVKRAIRYLLKSQGASGMIGPDVDRAMYNHLLGTVALCEAYGMTEIPVVRDQAERAVGYLLAARSPGRGWRYTYQPAESDSSVTGWAVIALKSAETAGISADPSIYGEVRRWLDGITVTAQVAPKLLGIKTEKQTDAGPSYLLTGYLSDQDAGKLVAVPGVNDGYHFTPAATAMMVMSTVLMERQLVPKAEAAIQTLLSFPPRRWDPHDKSTWKGVDFYYWFHATYAMFQVTEVKDERWKRWDEAMKGAVLATQNLAEKGRCKEGSWEPADRWSCEGGRVYATAVGALTLEVYYRYPKLLALPKTGRELELK